MTKGADTAQIAEALAAGVGVLGENRVQDALAKKAVIGDAPAWHLIGHLQTNKVSDVVGHFSLIHSVDSLRLVGALEKEAERRAQTQDVLVQVNASGETSKYGVRPDETAGLVRAVASSPHLCVRGLMTMAPLVGDPEEARPVFRRLRALRDSLNALPVTRYALRDLSMGMSNDFEVAVEEGATLVRIGSAIFQP